MNVGRILSATTTVIVAGIAHWPAVGVNVYTVEAAAVVVIAAFHVPVMPSIEVVGKVAGVASTQ